jgi:hypothetical protein
MSQDKDDTSGGQSYLLRVGADNRRYAQSLLAENQKLRALVAGLENERLQLLDKVQLTEHLLAEHEAMRSVVSSLEQEKHRLQEQVLRGAEEQARHARDREQLQLRLADIELQSRRFSEEYVVVERRNNDLMNLYVASYRLHATVSRDEVIGTIQEIVANLVGCEEQALFEIDPQTTELQLTASIGIDASAYRSIRVGEGPIGRSAQEGETYLGGENDKAAGLTACIPLKLDGRVMGAIALFRMLPQKPSLEEVDHELFDLLATHAATALYCTKLHAEQPSASAASR